MSTPMSKISEAIMTSLKTRQIRMKNTMSKPEMLDISLGLTFPIYRNFKKYKIHKKAQKKRQNNSKLCKRLCQ